MMKVHNGEKFNGFLANFRHVERKWMSKINQWDVHNKLMWKVVIYSCL
jgi:hypothetical protein